MLGCCPAGWWVVEESGCSWPPRRERVLGVHIGVRRMWHVVRRGAIELLCGTTVRKARWSELYIEAAWPCPVKPFSSRGKRSGPSCTYKIRIAALGSRRHFGSSRFVSARPCACNTFLLQRILHLYGTSWLSPLSLFPCPPLAHGLDGFELLLRRKHTVSGRVWPSSSVKGDAYLHPERLCRRDRVSCVRRQAKTACNRASR